MKLSASDSESATPRAAAGILLLDHALISPGENARKWFDPIAMAGLKASIREHGVRQNITVTPDPAQEGRYVLCAGERRWRATGELLQDLAQEAGMEQLREQRRFIRAEVLSAEDAAKAYILGLIENLQRENITPLEEADAFFAMEHRINPATGHKFTHREIALEMGKLNGSKEPDEAYVRKRLKLRLAPDALLEKVNDGTIAPSVAELVGRVPDARSREELVALIMQPKEQQLPLNYAQTDALIKERFMVQLRGCGFDTEDEALLPVEMEEDLYKEPGQTMAEWVQGAEPAKRRVRGGACTDCPFRSGNNPELQGELSTGSRDGKRGRTSGVSPDLCTNPSCFRAKQDAAWMVRRRAAEAGGQKCIDGNAAQKIFSGWEGQIAQDSGYVLPNQSVNGAIVSWRPVKENWGQLAKKAGVKCVMVRNPHTQGVEALVPVKEVVAAVRKEAGGKETIFDKPKEERRDPEKAAAEKAEKIEGKAFPMLFEVCAEKLRTLRPGDTVLGSWLLQFLLKDFFGRELLRGFLGFKPDVYVEDEKLWKAVEKRLTEETKGTPHAWIRWAWLFLLDREFAESSYEGLIEHNKELMAVLDRIGVAPKEIWQLAEAQVNAPAESAAKKKPAAPAKPAGKAKPAKKAKKAAGRK